MTIQIVGAGVDGFVYSYRGCSQAGLTPEQETRDAAPASSGRQYDGEVGMVSVTVEPVGDPAGEPAVRFALGVAAPIAVASLAYALWWISDRLLYVGPIDRAAFGWAVVIPLWVSTPIAAGFVWNRLTRRGSALAAVVVGAVVSGAAAALFWRAVAHPSCEFGATRAPIDWVLPSLLVGVVIGGGLAVSGLLAATLVRRGRPWRAAVLGAGTEVVLVFAAIVSAGVVLIGPGCQRPPL